MGDYPSTESPEGASVMTVPRKYNSEEKKYEGPEVAVTLVSFSVDSNIQNPQT